jgi:hypothetical protein
LLIVTQLHLQPSLSPLSPNSPGSPPLFSFLLLFSKRIKPRANERGVSRACWCPGTLSVIWRRGDEESGMREGGEGHLLLLYYR